MQKIEATLLMLVRQLEINLKWNKLIFRNFVNFKIKFELCQEKFVQGEFHYCGNFSIRFSRQYVSLFTLIAAIVVPVNGFLYFLFSFFILST